ncbi:hypothetical protein ACJJTC_005005 [Scirpophaga incertulas]
MEPGFVMANSANLPRIDLLMLGEFLATNKEFCSSEFRNLTLLIKLKLKTRDQFKNNLWSELRYGRVTASKAYEVSRCQTNDGTLISIIMGGKIPDTPAMKRDPNFSINNNVEIICVNLDDEYLSSLLESIIKFWKTHVFHYYIKV